MSVISIALEIVSSRLTDSYSQRRIMKSCSASWNLLMRVAPVSCATLVAFCGFGCPMGRSERWPEEIGRDLRGESQGLHLHGARVLRGSLSALRTVIILMIHCSLYFGTLTRRAPSQLYIFLVPRVV